MKANLSRPVVAPPVQRRSVLLGQGQVILDAYVNEQSEITARRIERGTADALGPVAVPAVGGGFRIDAVAGPDMPNPPPLVGGAGDLYVSPGRLYLDGWLLENPATNTVARIAGITGGPAPADGTKLAYLEAWLAQRTDLDDPALRDPAIDPADVPGRVEIRWRIGLLDVPDGTMCGQQLGAWDALVAPPAARLAARLNQGGPADEHCDPVENGGYRGVENSLYRIEVLEAGTVGVAPGPSITWARDNASIATAWRESDVARKRIRVDAVERGGALLFRPGDTIELVDGGQEARAARGVLVRVAEVEETWLILDPATPVSAFLDPATLTQPRVRLWAGPAMRVNGSGWVALEDGIEIRLQPGVSYTPGQYWLVPARVRPWGTSGTALDWPTEPDPNDPNQTRPAFLPPAGPERRFARLALLRRQGGAWTDVVDCRPIFPAATALLSLLPHGGDGQDALPDGPLAAPLRVRLTRGTAPVAGARIRFRVTAGGGTVVREAPGGTPAGSCAVLTDANGVAGVRWTLAGGAGDTPPDPSELVAELMPPAAARLPDDDVAGNAVPGQAVRFVASIARDDRIAYTPVDGKNLAKPGETWITVHEAINRLAAREGSGGDCFTVGEGGRFFTLNQALDWLEEQRDLRECCLCLLPGEHVIDKPIDFRGPKRDKSGGLALTIRGCAQARIVQRAPVAFIGLRWLLLEQLAIEATEGAEPTPPPTALRAEAGSDAPSGLNAAAAADEAPVIAATRAGVPLTDIAVTEAAAPRSDIIAVRPDAAAAATSDGRARIVSDAVNIPGRPGGSQPLPLPFWRPLITINNTIYVRLRDVQFHNDGLDAPAIGIASLIDAVVADCRMTWRPSETPQAVAKLLMAVARRILDEHGPLIQFFQPMENIAEAAGDIANSTSEEEKHLLADSAAGNIQSLFFQAPGSAINGIGAFLADAVAQAIKEDSLGGSGLLAARRFVEVFQAATGSPPSGDAPAAAAALYDLLLGPGLRARTALILASAEGKVSIVNLQTEGLVALNGQPRAAGAGSLLPNMPYIGYRIRQFGTALGGQPDMLTIRDSMLGGIVPSEVALRCAEALMLNDKDASFGRTFGSVVLSGVALKAGLNAIVCGTLHLSQVEFQAERVHDGVSPALLGICRQGGLLGCQALGPSGSVNLGMSFALVRQGAMVGADAAKGLNGDGFSYAVY